MHHQAIPGKMRACALFFDFMSAFPSIAHEFLWTFLLFAGFPVAFVLGVKKMYTNNRHFIKIGGKSYPGPLILAGVRQGCPLSMVLFALCIDALLDNIDTILDRTKGETIGAFADDVAVVIEDFLRSLPLLHGIFECFGKLTGLHLNLNKCCIVPLCSHFSFENFQLGLDECTPQWSQFKIVSHAEYLGFLLGPGSVGRMWDGVIRKATDTIIRWKNLHAGIFFNILACNIYILSLFSYIGQLVHPDDKVKQFLAYMERNLFVGPGGWIPPGFMCSLLLIGFPVQLRDLYKTCFAAKIRVALDTCADYKDISDDLLVNINLFNNRDGSEQHPHYLWHRYAFAKNIHFARTDFQHQYCSGEDAASIIARSKRKSEKIQKKVMNMILDQTLPMRKHRILEQIRKRISRFRLGIPLGHAVNRAYRRLVATKHFRPTIVANFIKTLLNAWPTTRRLRTLRNARLHGRCPFCSDGPDSLEHFGQNCEICERVFRHFGASYGTMLQFLALDSSTLHTPFLQKKLTALSVLFAMRATLVHHPTHLPPLNIDALVRSGCSFH